MLFDAIVLAGGRSSRLAGEPKSGLVIDGSTLLERTVAAASAARHITVVGDPAALPPALLLSPRVLLTREQPEFAGPAAGIAAGLAVLDALATEPSDGVLVLACDMPGVAVAVEELLAAASGPSLDSAVVALDADGREQFLAALYPTPILADAVAAHAGRLEGLAVRALLVGMPLTRVGVPRGSTDDVDTWEDAARLGVTAPQPVADEVAVAAASASGPGPVPAPAPTGVIPPLPRQETT